MLLATLLIQYGFYRVHITDAVLYRDEANDCFTARESWVALFHLFITDWDPYAWIICLKFWTWIFGTSEAALRGLCLFSLMGSSIIMYKLIRRWGENTGTAFAAASLIGLGAPMLLVSVGYARPYALSLLFSVTMLERYFAVREIPSRFNFATFAIAALLFGNIQPVNYAIAAALVAISILDAYSKRNQWKIMIRHLVIIPGIVGLLAIPSLVQSFRFGAVDTGLPGAGAEMPLPVWVGVVMYRSFTAVLPLSHTLLQYATDENPAGLVSSLISQPGSFTSLVWLLATVATGMFLFVSFRNQIANRRLFEAAILMTIPLVLLALGSMKIDRISVPFRSYAAMAPGIVMLLVLLLRNYRPLLWAVVALAVLRSSSMLIFDQEERPGIKSDVKEAVAWMSPQVEESDLIILANPALGPTFHYYSEYAGREIVLPYQGPILYWNDIQLWKDLNSPENDREAESLVTSASLQNKRVWFIWGGAHLNEATSSWHPYYAPRSYEGARRGLHSYFINEASATFDKTAEPFHVELHVPLSRSQDKL